MLTGEAKVSLKAALQARLVRSGDKGRKPGGKLGEAFRRHGGQKGFFGGEVPIGGVGRDAGGAGQSPQAEACLALGFDGKAGGGQQRSAKITVMISRHANFPVYMWTSHTCWIKPMYVAPT